MGRIFILANGMKVYVDDETIKKIITIRLSDNPYYEYSGFITRNEVQRFLEGSRDKKLHKKINRYIVFYAENIIFSTYLYLKASAEYSKGNGKDDSEPYLKQMQPFLQKLRKLYKKNEDPKKLINLCLQHAIDPL